MECMSNKTVLCNQSVCSSGMKLLRVLTKAGTNFESVTPFENEVVGGCPAMYGQ